MVYFVCTGTTPSTIALGDVSPYFHQNSNTLQTHNYQEQLIGSGNPPAIPPPMASTNLTGSTPNRTAIVPPLNLSMESLTPYVDEDITGKFMF
jgi:hypothetical protein